MRTVCGLLTVLLILGPIGMGMLFNVDAPLLEDVSSITDVEETIPEDHGTRITPIEGPTFVYLYFHRTNTVMNTTEPWFSDFTATSSATFLLDNPLSANLWVRDKVGASGIMAQVYLAGVNSVVTISVYDYEEGKLIGTADYGPFTTGATAIRFDIAIPFEIPLNSNYNFSAGHRISAEFSFTNLGQLRYDSVDRQSNLRLYCKPITDIEVTTLDFTGNSPPQNKFYPKNIDLTLDRKQVQIKGKITDAWGNYDVDEVNIEIQPPSGSPILRTADWYINSGIYNYTWFYSKTSTDPGKYKVTTQVIDKQGHNYSASSSFNMSYYGVVLTSPEQEGGEGKYLAQAEKDIIQNKTTTYKINVYNVGANATAIEIETALTTLNRDWWDWKLEDKNITLDPDLKSGRIDSISAGGKATIFLTVDGTNKALKDYVGILVQGTCVEETSESDTLNTRTDVVVQYDAELKFLDGSKNQTKYVEMGDSVSYEFKVTNTGGADDYIWLELGTPPSGWTITLSGNDLLKNSPIYGDYYVHLAPGESSEKITLTLDTMANGDDVTANITITGKSWGSSQQSSGQDIESDTLTTTTIMTKGVKLEIVGDGTQDWSPGDNRLIFSLKLTNTGTTTTSFTVSFEPLSSSDGWGVNDISLDQENLQLGPSNNELINLYVEPSIEVLAGDYDITVRADRGTAPSSRYDEVTVSCTVNEYYNIEVTDPPSLELYGEAEPGKDVEYEIQIKNNGNTQEKVNILVDLEKGWKLDFGDASDTWSKDMAPQDVETIPIVLTVPDDATGDETVDITISVVPVESDQIDIKTHTTIKSQWFQTLFILLVPILLLIVIVVMVIVIYKRR